MFYHAQWCLSLVSTRANGLPIFHGISSMLPIYDKGFTLSCWNNLSLLRNIGNKVVQMVYNKVCQKRFQLHWWFLWTPQKYTSHHYVLLYASNLTFHSSFQTYWKHELDHLQSDTRNEKAWHICGTSLQPQWLLNSQLF